MLITELSIERPLDTLIISASELELFIPLLTGRRLKTVSMNAWKRLSMTVSICENRAGCGSAGGGGGMASYPTGGSGGGMAQRDVCGLPERLLTEDERDWFPWRRPPVLPCPLGWCHSP